MYYISAYLWAIILNAKKSTCSYNQGWQVCAGLAITAGKNTVITSSSQTTTVVTNCHKSSQTQNQC